MAFVRGIHRDRWIIRTKGQLRGKCFHLMTSSWRMLLVHIHVTLTTPANTASRALLYHIDGSTFLIWHNKVIPLTSLLIGPWEVWKQFQYYNLQIPYIG